MTELRTAVSTNTALRSLLDNWLYKNKTHACLVSIFQTLSPSLDIRRSLYFAELYLHASSGGNDSARSVERSR